MIFASRVWFGEGCAHTTAPLCRAHTTTIAVATRPQQTEPSKQHPSEGGLLLTPKPLFAAASPDVQDKKPHKNLVTNAIHVKTRSCHFVSSQTQTHIYLITLCDVMCDVCHK